MSTELQIAKAIADHLAVIPDVRVYHYMADAFTPPGIVIRQATIRWESQWAAFGRKEWLFPIALVVPRTHDLTGQIDLDRITGLVENLLGQGPDLAPGLVQESRLVDSQPVNVTVSGVEYPGRVINLRIIA
jgi:hypothetical protein